MAELYPYPRFSLAERDRRWQAVRARMAEQGLDAIIMPQNTGHSMDFQSNTRYLTHCGDADVAAVFPPEGEVAAIATSAAARWPNVQDWTHDIREARRRYAELRRSGKFVVQSPGNYDPETEDRYDRMYIRNVVRK